MFTTHSHKIMEKILELNKKLNLDDDLLKFCKVQLLTKADIKEFGVRDDDWLLSLKIEIEYDLAYEKL